VRKINYGFFKTATAVKGLTHNKSIEKKTRHAVKRHVNKLVSGFVKNG